MPNDEITNKTEKSNDLYGNTIFYKAEILYSCTTNLKDKELIKLYRGKPNLNHTLLHICVLALFLSLLIAGLILNDRTTYSTALIASGITGFVLYSTAYVFVIQFMKKTPITSFDKNCVQFYQTDLYSSFYRNSKLISTYVINYQDITKIEIVKDYLIFFGPGNKKILVINIKGFTTPEDFKNVVSLLRQTKIEVN